MEHLSQKFTQNRRYVAGKLRSMDNIEFEPCIYHYETTLCSSHFDLKEN